MNVTEDQLRQFIERIEAMNDAIKDQTEDRKEIYAEAKVQGYDTKILRRIVAERKKRPDQRAEERAALEAYEAALGM